MTISFDYPLVEMDSSRISLVRFGEGEDMYRVRYELRRDSVDIRKWMLSAQWIPEQKYQLVIPDSVFLDVAGQRNDSIKADFSILSPDKFGTLTVNVKGQTDSSRYILQLLNDKNSVLQEKRDAVTGKYIFRYVNPGDVKLRVIDDVNGNGQWDTGDLILRKQPERVEIYIPESETNDSHEGQLGHRDNGGYGRPVQTGGHHGYTRTVAQAGTAACPAPYRGTYQEGPAAATTAEYAAQPKCQRCFQPHWGVQYRQQDVLRPEESGYCAKRRGF